MSSFDNIIIFGDFNCEVKEEPMYDFCSSFGLKSLIKAPTCFKSAENPSCIDLILTNRPHCFQNSIVLETGLSDFHKLTTTVMKTTFRKKPAKIIKYRDYKNYSAFKFQNEVNFCLAGIDLNVISNDEYVSLLTEVLSKHAPIKTKCLRANDQPFMTKELRKEHMKRSRLRNIYLKNRNETNAIAYKRQRNKCVFLLKKVKKTYFGNLKPSKISDNKNFWKTVNPLFSEKGVSIDKISLAENKEIISDDKHVAEIFNDFFSNAVKNLNIDYYEHFSFDHYFLCKDTEQDDPILKAIEKYENHPSILKIKETISHDECFRFRHTDLKSVVLEINNLDASKSSPIESLPAKALKDISDIIAPKIVTDFNSSVSNGIFPQKQKLADVTPIFKKEDKLFKGNYRPVSILPALSKIFEKLMSYQIDEYMKDKFSLYLCGFRKGMSSQNCLLLMLEKWRKCLDNNGKAGMLLTDLSKAFDSLVHDLFIAKLHAYGFEYMALKLINSYLTDRFQRVRVNASFSSWREITLGVPQGSILGPQLYNINSNDLFLFLMLEIANYADDNSPFSCNTTIPKVISDLQNEGGILLNWLKNNGQKANPDKFHLLLSDTNDAYSVKIENYTIQNGKCEKLLGIKFDNKLNFDEHVSTICSNASQKLHALARIGNYMTLQQRKIIMKAFILSQFGYCPLVWMFHSRKLNHRINRIHERALRIVYKDNESTFKELLDKDDSFTIHEKNIQTLAIELYKVYHGLAPKIMKLVFPIKENVKYARENKFITRNVKTVSYGTETLAHIGPKIWSIVPNDFKNFSLSIFTRKIKRWKPEKCPCRLCKTYIRDLGFVVVD